MKNNILKALGFIGLDPIQDFILAGLVTGDPVLLIGAHGSAKTTLARTLAGALGLNYWAYDASKALFEDLIGFPNPSKLSSGCVDYVRTPLSIWDKEFILVDEISRATPSMQNKWLEVIRSRQIMGKALPKLKYILAAMNPPGYLGSYAVDAALASRFAFITVMPEAKDMTENELSELINTIAQDDAFMVKGVLKALPGYSFVGANTKVNGKLNLIINKTRKELVQVHKLQGKLVEEYVKQISMQLRTKDLYLDGRRLGMIHRNLLVVIALEKALGNSAEQVSLETLFYKTLLNSIPFRAQGLEFEDGAIYASHLIAYQAASEGITSAKSFLPRIIGKANILDAMDKYRENVHELCEEDHHEILNTIVERYKEAAATEKAKPITALIRFLKIAREFSHLIPPDVIAQAMEHYQEFSSMLKISANEFYDIICGGETDTIIDLTDPFKNLCFRMAVEIHRQGIARYSFLERDAVIGTYKKLIEVSNKALEKELKK